MKKATVQAAKCKCGGYIKLAVIPFGESLNRTDSREFGKLIEEGYFVTMISLDHAKKARLCFGSCGKMLKK